CDEHRADHDDAVDRIGSRHQRGMQRRWNLADDLETHQQAQNQDGQIGDQRFGHDVHAPARPLGETRAAGEFAGDDSAGCACASSAAVAGWTTLPAWVTRTPAWISSVGSTVNAPSWIRWA